MLAIRTVNCPRLRNKRVIRRRGGGVMFRPRSRDPGVAPRKIRRRASHLRIWGDACICFGGLDPPFIYLPTKCQHAGHITACLSQAAGHRSPLHTLAEGRRKSRATISARQEETARGHRGWSAASAAGGSNVLLACHNLPSHTPLRPFFFVCRVSRCPPTIWPFIQAETNFVVVESIQP